MEGLMGLNLISEMILVKSAHILLARSLSHSHVLQRGLKMSSCTVQEDRNSNIGGQ